MFPTETVAIHLVFYNRITNPFHAQLCPAAEIVQVKFLAFAAQIRIRPVALPEKPQKIFPDDHGCRLKDDKALGVVEEFFGTRHRILEDLDQLDHRL